MENGNCDCIGFLGTVARIVVVDSLYNDSNGYLKQAQSLSSTRPLLDPPMYFLLAVRAKGYRSYPKF